MTTLEATTAQITLASLSAVPALSTERFRIVPWLTLVVPLLLIACTVAQIRYPGLLAAAGWKGGAVHVVI